MTRTRRAVVAVVTMIAVVGAGGWFYQSELIGIATKVYLQRIASQEAERGDLTQRRQTIAQLHRQLLMAPPIDLLVPELFDFVTQLAARVATGEISLAWGAYLYTSHYRDAVARPNAAPRPSVEEIAAKIQEGVEFYYLRKRPDVPGVQVSDLWDDGESYTVEEIEQAEREGRDLTRER